MNPVERTMPCMPEEQTGDSFSPTVLPEIPSADLDLYSVIGAPTQPPSTEQEKTQKIQKRASNVVKLAQENEKLKEELKAMTDRLEAAEELARRKLKEHRRDTESTPK